MTGVANNHCTYHVGNCGSEKFFIQSLKCFWLFSKCQFYVYLFWVLDIVLKGLRFSSRVLVSVSLRMLETFHYISVN